MVIGNEEYRDLNLRSEPRQDSVLINFNRFSGLYEIHRLDMKLFDGIPSHIGAHDGHEVDMDESHGTIFTYGENAEELFKAMQPILIEFDFIEGATVCLNFINNRKKPLELEFKFEKQITNNEKRITI